MGKLPVVSDDQDAGKHWTSGSWKHMVDRPDKKWRDKLKLTTTLKQIKKHNPCEDGYAKALKYFKDVARDIHLKDIIESNGINDALWCLRMWPEYNNKWRLYAVWCARQVQHLITDQRLLYALDVAERFANGNATTDEFNAASDAALSAQKIRLLEVIDEIERTGK